MSGFFSLRSNFYSLSVGGVTDDPITIHCRSLSSDFPVTGQAQWTHHYVLYDSSDTPHPLTMATYAVTSGSLADCDNFASSRQGYTIDGSDYYVDLDAGFIQGPDGTKYNASASRGDYTSVYAVGATDPNGNTLPSNSFVLPSDQTYWPASLSVKDPMGSSQTIALQYQNVAIQTAYCNDTNAHRSPGGICTEYSGTKKLLSRITLPDSTYYSFEYSSDGLANLSSLRLPTGGVVSYTYYNAPFYTHNSPRYGPVNAHSRVSERDVNDLSHTSPWLYSYGGDGNSLSTQVQSPAGDCELHYSGVGTAGTQRYLPIETKVVKQLGCGASAKILDTVETVYTVDEVQETMTGQQTPVFAGNARPISVKHTLPSGVSSRVEYSYNQISRARSPTSAAYWISGSLGSSTEYTAPSEVRHFDFGSETPYLVEDFGFLHDVGSSAAGASDYLNANLVNITTSKTDYAGGNPSSPVAKTTYEFDNYTDGISPRANSAWHDSNYGTGYLARANKTAESSWISSSVALSSRFQYDVLGNVVKTTDANGNATKYFYDDSGLADSACLPSSGSLNSYKSATQNALGHTSEMTSSSCTGAVRTLKDPNDVQQGRAGTTYSYDNLSRIASITKSDGSVQSTSISSSTPIQATVSRSALPDVTYIYDGLGRISETDVASACPLGAPDIVRVSRDESQRLTQTTNPYCTTSDPTYGIASEYVDPMGRTEKLVTADGGAEFNCYNGSISSSAVTCDGLGTTPGYNTESFDEAGNSVRKVQNAGGSVVEVTEQPSTVALRSAYAYDALQNLTGISQSGKTAETPRDRSFSYDWLSRLTSANNPETGLLTYLYFNSGGSLCSGLEGLPCSKTDARGQTVSYSYDSLNRLTGKARSGGSTDLYYYDGQVGPWAPPSVVGANAIGRLSFSRSYNPDLAGPVCDIYGAQQCEDEFYGYDAMGRLTQRRDASPSEWGHGEHDVYAGYDLAGNLVSLRYPDNRAITNHYDAAGRLDKVSAGTQGSLVSDYISNITYLPSGATNTITYGNGATETLTQNSRLQPCHIVASFGSIPLMDRSYSYTSAAAVSPCGPEAGNNGNIWHIFDGLGTHPNTQNFTYDNLNRLLTFEGPNMSSAYRSQSYNYDSFGNMYTSNSYPTATPNNVGTLSARAFANPSFSPATITPFTANNRLVDASFDCTPIIGTDHYDAAGNVQCDGSNTDLNARQYLWDAESRITRLNAQQAGNTYYQKALYTYDTGGNRIRVDQFAPGASQASSWREYSYFGGQMMAEKDQDGNWTDYVYANGKKVAKLQSQNQVHIETSGTPAARDQWYDLGTLHGYTIQSGDKLYWRQYQSGNAQGGILIINDQGQNTAWNLADQNGDWSNNGTVTGTWQTRYINLDSYQWNIAYIAVGLDQGTTGQASIDFRDMVILSVDGTIHPVFTGEQASVTLLGGNMPGTSASTVTSTDQEPRYYLADHLGTTQMELTGGGWPIWQGQFAPFGQELDSQNTSMRFKFTGKERDTESGLDYFGARYYGSLMGRWMSPDWASKPEAVPYSVLDDPQSLNLYGYVRNNPLSRNDPDGHADVWEAFKAIFYAKGAVGPQAGTEVKFTKYLSSGASIKVVAETKATSSGVITSAVAEVKGGVKVGPVDLSVKGEASAQVLKNGVFDPQKPELKGTLPSIGKGPAEGTPNELGVSAHVAAFGGEVGIDLDKVKELGTAMRQSLTDLGGYIQDKLQPPPSQHGIPSPVPQHPF